MTTTDTTTEGTSPEPLPTIVSTDPDVVVAGRSVRRGEFALLEYLTPDYVTAERVAYWEQRGYEDVHFARQQVVYTRLTEEQAAQERSR